VIVKLQFRYANAAEWEASNVVLDVAEPGYDSTNQAFKLGDGVSTWADLPYQSADPAVFQAAASSALAAQQAAEQAAAQAEDAALAATQASRAMPRVATAERPDPTVEPGIMVYDTDLGQPIISNGVGWEDMVGSPVV
jgi:hypothetical protein